MAELYGPTQATLGFILIGVGLAIYVAKEIPGGKPEGITKIDTGTKPVAYEVEILSATKDMDLQEIERRIESGYEYVATVNIGGKQDIVLRRKKA